MGVSRSASRRRTGGPHTGLVLAVRGRHATVLAPGGGVVQLRSPVPGTKPGDVLVLPEWVVRGGAPPAANAARAALVAGLCLVVALTAVSAALFFSPLPAVAMVTVDFNPSIALLVNDLLRVVSVRGLNADGLDLANAIDPGRRHITDVLAQIAHQFMTHADQPAAVFLVVSALPLDESADLPEPFMRALGEALARVEHGLATAGLDRRPAPRVHSLLLPVPAEVARAAREAGVSPGRFAVSLGAAAAGLTGPQVAAIAAGSGMRDYLLAQYASTDRISEGITAPGQLKRLMAAYGDEIASDIVELSLGSDLLLSGDEISADQSAGGPGPPAEPPGLNDAAGRAGEVLERLDNLLRGRGRTKAGASTPR